MKHKHADLMLQYAQDAMTTETPWELWEYKDTYKNGQWLTLNSNPAWYPTDEYRRKPRTIKINGVDVPETLQGSACGGSAILGCSNFRTPTLWCVEWLGIRKRPAQAVAIEWPDPPYQRGSRDPRQGAVELYELGRE